MAAATIGDGQPKYLNSPDTPLFEKGRVLYAWAAARAALARQTPNGGAAAIVVEGYMDVIALHRAGFATAVAPLGTALTEMQLAELWRLSPEPVLCFDGDTAGQRAALRALDRALPLLQPGRSLRFATLPPGEDPDSLIRGAGAVELCRDPRGRAAAVGDAVAGRAGGAPDRYAGAPRRSRAPADGAGRADRRSRGAERIPPVSARPAVPAGPGRAALAGLDPGIAARCRSGAWPGARGRRRRRRARPDGVNREVFLGMLVRWPGLIEEWIEEIAAIDVPEPELDSLRRAILEIANAHPGLDADALQQHLALCGHAEILSALTITIGRHAGFAARGGDDPEVIRSA